MDLVVDGIIYYLQRYGGISRIYTEILPRMCRQLASLDIDLLMTGKSKQILPEHSRIRVKSIPSAVRLLKPDLLWHSTINELTKRWEHSVIGNSEGKIWHSTYYTMPGNWHGGVVVTVADIAYELYPELFNGDGAEQFRKLKRLCILGADTIICISESTKKDVIEYYGIDADKISVVPLACGDIFQRKASPASGKPFIFYVGSRAHYKNFKLLAEAYHKWEHRKDICLVAAGPGWSKEEFEYNQCITLIENPTDLTLSLLYNQAEAFVLPSLYEGFGIPLLEAMSCGCPVVASTIPSTIEVVGSCPVYFNPKDPESLKVSLSAAVSEGRNSTRVCQGLERVKNYSWGKTAQQTLEVYRSL